MTLEEAMEHLRWWVASVSPRFLAPPLNPEALRLILDEVERLKVWQDEATAKLVEAGAAVGIISNKLEAAEARASDAAAELSGINHDVKAGLWRNHVTLGQRLDAIIGRLRAALAEGKKP